MSSERKAAIILFLLAVPSAVGLPLTAHGEQCAVPCGYIYPLLILATEADLSKPIDLAAASTTYAGNVTYKFDVVNEGFTTPDPARRIVISFDYPKRPAWLEAAVDPPEIEVPINPVFIEMDASDPNNLRGFYEYTVPINLTLTKRAEPTPTDSGLAKLLVFAKSTESGLYKPGYGIKEVKLRTPIGAVAAEAAAERRIGDAGSTPVPETLREHGGVAVRMLADGPAAPWRPVTLDFSIEGTGEYPGPVGEAEYTVTVVDEDANLLYTTGTRVATDGKASFVFTAPEAGRYDVQFLVRPTSYSSAAWQPVVASFPVLVGSPSAPLLRYATTYEARYSEVVTDLAGTNNAYQYEKLIPLPIERGVRRGSFGISLRGAAPGLPQAPTGPASLTFELLDPDGSLLRSVVADAARPDQTIEVSGFPRSGTHFLHVYGVGAGPKALAGASYDVTAALEYTSAPVIENARDGRVAPLPGGAVAAGKVNLEMQPLDDLSPWRPVTMNFAVKKQGTDEVVLHPDLVITVAKEDGTILHTTGLLHPHGGQHALPFTFPETGRYVVHLFAAPTAEASAA
ncbi:MAG: hypothetical protein ACT4PT_08535, partial [Methanobacteriota archaeon]